MNNQNRFRQLCFILFFLCLIVLVVHIESLIRFNRQTHHIHGNDDSGDIRMIIDARADSTSSWLKRSFTMDNGRKVDLIGQTIDGTLDNQSRDAIQDWELRINIVGDCFINQAWNGEVEIHQFAGTDKEKVQRMNLQNYNLDDVTFEYRYDGDLLIPLQQGDYVIYYPSVRFSEMPIVGGENAKIGVIFYYLDALDLSDYDVDFHFHRSFTQGYTFYAFIGLAVLWALCMTVSGAGTLAYRRAMKEMELRKSGIFSMSDIYDLIYIIHLPTGEMTPVSVDEKLERDRPKNQTAKELLSETVLRDTDEKFRERMLEFVDTDTLAERLKERNSVVSEFLSTRFGWYSIRFYAMDRIDGKPLENVILTLQDINDEKKEQEDIIHRIEAAESINRAKVMFIDNIADDLQRPLENLVELNDKILKQSHDEAVRGYARSAVSAASQLLLLTDGIADGFGFESGKLRPLSMPYSLRAVLIDILGILLPLAEQIGLTVALDVAETLPDRLQGDARILRELLVTLMTGLMHMTDDGKLQLSVYGKVLEDRVHLLISCRIQSDAAGKHGDVPSDLDGTSEPTGLSIQVVSVLLEGLNSSLKSVRAPAGRMELYFEIEQRVLDTAPVGKLSIEDAQT